MPQQQDSDAEAKSAFLTQHEGHLHHKICLQPCAASSLAQAVHHCLRQLRRFGGCCRQHLLKP